MPAVVFVVQSDADSTYGCVQRAGLTADQELSSATCPGSQLSYLVHAPNNPLWENAPTLSILGFRFLYECLHAICMHPLTKRIGADDSHFILEIDPMDREH